jgi:hypothetical protein
MTAAPDPRADGGALVDVLRATGLFTAVLLVNGILAVLFFTWLQSWECPEVDAHGILPLLGAARSRPHRKGDP